MTCKRLKLSLLIAVLPFIAGTAQGADYPQPQPCYDAALINSGRAP